MDLFSGLIPFLQSLLASSIVIVHLIAGGVFADYASLYSSIAANFPSHQAAPAPASPAVSTTTAAAPAVASTQATSTKKTVPVVAPKPVAQAAATPAAPKPSAPLAPVISPDAVNTLARASIVNILCTLESQDELRSISGSGVIIDSRGVILTNAHIGQYFLLTQGSSLPQSSCVIRTGSPAINSYYANLIYLPPAWIEDNASQINSEHGVGTGENDYAFLRITGATNPAVSLPASFPNIALTTDTPNTGDDALVAGYPAGFLDAQTIQQDLYATSAFTNIGQLYTFDNPNEVDVVSLGGTVVSQGGSSGGAVVRSYDGDLIGLIATATTGTTTATRDLRAITVGYINQSLKDADKGGLVGLLTSNFSTIEKNFAPSFTQEKQELLTALSQ